MLFSDFIGRCRYCLNSNDFDSAKKLIKKLSFANFSEKYIKVLLELEKAIDEKDMNKSNALLAILHELYLCDLNTNLFYEDLINKMNKIKVLFSDEEFNKARILLNSIADDINKHRCNQNKILQKIIWQLLYNCKKKEVRESLVLCGFFIKLCDDAKKTI